MTSLLFQRIEDTRKKKLKKGFTLIEMLIVLLVISVLILLFVPNLSQQRGVIDDKGSEAVVKVVETQIELFRLEKNREPSANELVSEGYVTTEQYEIYQNWRRPN